MPNEFFVNLDELTHYETTVRKAEEEARPIWESATRAHENATNAWLGGAATTAFTELTNRWKTHDAQLLNSITALADRLADNKKLFITTEQNNTNRFHGIQLSLFA
ncbi:MAG: WXG100 family type VII secretion target [Mycobacteriaceae bacterium]